MIFKKFYIPNSFRDKNMWESSTIEFNKNFIRVSRAFFKTLITFYILYNIATILFFPGTNLPFTFGLADTTPMCGNDPDYLVVAFAVLLAPVLSVFFLAFCFLAWFLAINLFVQLFTVFIPVFDVFIRIYFGKWVLSNIWKHGLTIFFILPLSYVFNMWTYMKED